MKNNLSKVWIIPTLALFVGTGIGWYADQTNILPTIPPPLASSQIKTNVSKNEFDLRMNMRKLWEDHITWTRLFLVSAANNASDTDAVTTRLLKNQEDIGNAIKPYYGNTAGDKLTTLLKEHITTAADLVKAAKANDQEAVSTANDKWYKNANSIADYLNSANPNNWPSSQMRSMMKEHLDLTKQEALDILENKPDAGVEDYDKVHDQILKMADMLSDGITKQFPSKF